MKSAYTRIRIALYTFAIGLASVWMYNGFQIAGNYIHVDLPEVESAPVIQVFVKSIFDTMGGGSSHGGPTVTLKRLENIESPRLKFRISNYLDRPVYIPRINSSNQASKDFIPYFVVCQNSDGGRLYTIPTTFEFASVPSRIASKSKADFTIEKPASAQRCALAVPIGVLKVRHKIWLSETYSTRRIWIYLWRMFATPFLK